MSGENSKQEIFIGIIPEVNGELNFYETYIRPTPKNNVFDTFAEAKADAVAKYTKRLEKARQQLADIENASELSVILMDEKDD